MVALIPAKACLWVLRYRCPRPNSVVGKIVEQRTGNRRLPFVCANWISMTGGIVMMRPRTRHYRSEVSAPEEQNLWQNQIETGLLTEMMISDAERSDCSAADRPPGEVAGRLRSAPSVCEGGLDTSRKNMSQVREVLQLKFFGGHRSVRSPARIGVGPRRDPEGYRYSRFCELYRLWESKLSITMRQIQVAGDKLFMDYAGDTVPVIVDGLTGEVLQAQIFVYVMGASSFSYVERSSTQTLGDWIGSISYGEDRGMA